MGGLRSFLQSRGGNFSMMTVLVMPVLFSGVALTVDVTRLVQARSELQNAVDAATLSASRLKDKTIDRQQTFRNFLATNLTGSASYVTVDDSSLEVKMGLNTIATIGEAEATVTLSLAHYLGTDRKIHVRSAAYESANAIEVAMVLDNTGSMGAANMTALREAATELVKILQATVSDQRDVKAALVPFVTAVNVKGEGYKESWIDTTGKATYNGFNFEKRADGTVYSHLDLFKALNVTWKGCVEARPLPDNLDDTEPTASRPASLFVPYFAPDNPGANATSPNSGTAWNNSYLNDTFKATPLKNSLLANQKSVARYLDTTVARTISETGSRSTGPNYACPTPIVPLTSDFAKLKTEIGKMIYWEGSGTNVAEGLAWGMRVLSPGEPYSQGASFEEPSVSKALIVFTDGENTVFGASDSTKAATDNNHLPFNKSDYGAYGFIDNNRSGTTDRTAQLNKINEWTQTMCTRLKEKHVRVFTVVFNALSATNQALYSKCASTPGDFFPTKDISSLKETFKKIGAQVAKLYLTQ